MLDINVNIKAPELAEAIRLLASTILATGITVVESSTTSPKAIVEGSKTESKVKKEATTIEEEKAADTASDSKTDTKTDSTEAGEEKEITIEQVRAKLAALSQAGKQAKAKALLIKYGATKVSELSKDNYAALLAEAGGM